MASEKYCLRWNDFESNISSAFRDIRQEEEFFDVTVACNEEQLQAHKVILSACSPFFKEVLRRNQHQYPVLYLRGVSFKDLEAVIDFMYHGEANVAQDDLDSFLQVAKDLKVKGLTQINTTSNEKTGSEIVTQIEEPERTEPKIEPHPPEQDISHCAQIDSPLLTPYSTSAPRPAFIQAPSLEANDKEMMIPAVKTEYNGDNQDLAKEDGGGECIEHCDSPEVKPEPTDTLNSAQDIINQNMVQLEQATVLDDMNRQQDSIVDQHDDDGYGIDDDEQYVDQGYGAGVTNQVGGQEASRTGQIFCQKCNKFVSAHNYTRHTKDVHGKHEALKCQYCHKVFKTENTRQYHLRRYHY